MNKVGLISTKDRKLIVDSGIIRNLRKFRDGKETITKRKAQLKLPETCWLHRGVTRLGCLSLLFDIVEEITISIDKVDKCPTKREIGGKTQKWVNDVRGIYHKAEVQLAEFIHALPNKFAKGKVTLNLLQSNVDMATYCLDSTLRRDDFKFKSVTVYKQSLSAQTFVQLMKISYQLHLVYSTSELSTRY